MDNKDEKLLNMLIRNGRTPVTHMASELGMTETAVRKRVKKLEDKGVIKAYTALVDPFFAGFSSVALVGVDTMPNSILSVFEQIKELSQVRYSALTTGDHMIIFEVWCKTPSELNSLIKNVEKLKGVTKVCPAIFLKRVE